MPIVATVEFHIAEDRLADARVLFADILAGTRGFPGAQRIDFLVDRDDPCAFFLYEEWASSEDEAAYRAWRAGDGAIEGLGGLLDRAPVLRRFEAAEEHPQN